MRKVVKKSLYYTVLMTAVMIMAFGMPSTSYAKETLSLTAVKTTDKGTVFTDSKESGGKGNTYNATEDNPLEISLSYHEIVLDYPDGFSFPFYFRVTPDSSGNYIGRYMVNVDYNKKKVVFTWLTANSEPYKNLVTPATRGMKSSYLQAGGQFFDGFSEMGFTYPTYKISVTEKGGSYSRSYTLGNGFLGAAGTTTNFTAAQTTSHPAVFVFCASGQKGESIYSYSDNQSEAEFALQSGGSLSKYSQSSFSSKVKNTSFTITYEFFGSTSEILDNTETGAVEELVSKVLIAIGDKFWEMVQGAFGREAAIDAIVFNQYEPVVVDYFGEGRGQYYSLMQTVVNGWFNAFKVWAEIILVIILVAMGVKTMLISGTGQQRKVSGMLVGWLTAVALLFFGPFFMKYALAMNDAIVRTLRNGAKSMYSIYNYDFITRYGIKVPNQYDYQTGEDSESVFIDMLYDIQEQVKDLESVEAEELDRLHADIDYIKTQLRQIEKTEGVSFRVQTPSSGNKTINNAEIQTMTQVLKGKSPEEAVNLACQKVLVKDPETKKYVEDSGMTEWVREKLLEYATSLQRANELEKVNTQISNYLQMVDKNVDLMGTMMRRAHETYRLVFVLIWLLLIYQLVALVVLYYKRLLMIAVLIIIFPLVVAFYAFEKLMGIEKPQGLHTWVVEYLLNVFIQSVHALVYVMLIETGLEIFEQDSDNWLVFFFSVTALFPMESIVRAIIGLRGNTVSALKDSAKQGRQYFLAGAATVGAVASVRKINKETNKEFDRKESKLEHKYEKQDARHQLVTSGIQAVITSAGARGANIGAAQDVFNRLQVKAERHTDNKRERKRKRMKARRTAAKVTRTAKALMQPVSTLAVGTALGGEGSDYVKAAAFSSFVAGTNQKVAPLSEKEKENVNNLHARFAPSAPATAAGGDTQGEQPTNTGANGFNPGGGRAAENARNEMENAENNTQNTTASVAPATNVAPTQSEANDRARHAALQDTYREGVAAKIGNVRTSQQLGIHVDDMSGD